MPQLAYWLSRYLGAIGLHRCQHGSRRWEWLSELRANGQLQPGTAYHPQARSALFAQFLHWLIERGRIFPDSPLPPYAELAKLPFHLSPRRVGMMIQKLRAEKILYPCKKSRRDAGTIRWQKRDEKILRFVGEMHAVRFDQLQRLLARHANPKCSKGQLSQSRTCEIIDRYEHTKLVIYRRVSHHTSGWIYLTRKGLQKVGLPYRATPPHLYVHLYWINEVRMKLEEHYPEMRWISERSIRAQQKRRVRGQTIPHPPDGILVLPNDDGTIAQIDIEVQVSKPAASQVAHVMGRCYPTGRNHPLWYFVTKEARAVVQAVYRKMTKNLSPMRPAISIIDLGTWITSHSENNSFTGY